MPSGVKRLSCAQTWMSLDFTARSTELSSQVTFDCWYSQCVPGLWSKAG